MTVAVSIHNLPEGTAIAIPLRSLGVSEWKMVWWAVFSSLPQPVGAVIAYYFVTLAKAFLPFGFGFAAGAMVYLVLTSSSPRRWSTGTACRVGADASYSRHRCRCVGDGAAGVCLEGELVPDDREIDEAFRVSGH